MSKVFPSLSEFSLRILETNNCERDILELLLLNEQMSWYD